MWLQGVSHAASKATVRRIKGVPGGIRLSHGAPRCTAAMSLLPVSRRGGSLGMPVAARSTQTGQLSLQPGRELSEMEDTVQRAMR